MDLDSLLARLLTANTNTDVVYDAGTDSDSGDDTDTDADIDQDDDFVLTCVDSTKCSSCGADMGSDICWQCGHMFMRIPDETSYTGQQVQIRNDRALDLHTSTRTIAHGLGVPVAIINSAVTKHVRSKTEKTSPSVMRAKITKSIIDKMFVANMYVDIPVLIKKMNASEKFPKYTSALFVQTPEKYCNKQEWQNSAYVSIVITHIAKNITGAELTKNIRRVQTKQHTQHAQLLIAIPRESRVGMLVNVVTWMYAMLTHTQILHTKRTNTPICALFVYAAKCMFGVRLCVGVSIKITDITINTCIAEIAPYVDRCWGIMCKQFTDIPQQMHKHH